MQNKKSKMSLTENMGQMDAGVFTPMSNGASDFSNGKPSMVFRPVVTGAPAVPANLGKPGVPATMSAMAAGSMGMPQNSSVSKEEPEEEEDSEETEEGSEEQTEVEEQAKIKFRSALVELLGEDAASETLIGNLEAIFEAAVTDRVEKRLTSILVQLDEGVTEHLNMVTETLVEKVDDYLDYVVEEWMQENAVAVEQGIKTQIAENFIVGMKNLFENHYIDVPAEKYNVLDDLYAQTKDLNTELNNVINENVNLKKQIALTECAGIFVAETRDLADTQVSKLQNLMENVSFNSPEEYRNKLCAIKENYLSRPKPVAKTIEPVEAFSPAPSAPTTLVEGYVSALGRLNKKV